jgi:hypothetical protein
MRGAGKRAKIEGHHVWSCPMSDAHATATDPNVAPPHQDVRDRFSPLQVTLCLVLGLAAIAGGIISGILFANN